MANKNLSAAKKAKCDEFYTQLRDIENELVHYKDFFKYKVVYCNCDDDRWSNFWKYFELNFDHLGLKKLIATHYDETECTYKIEMTRGNDVDGDGKMTEKDIVQTPLSCNGDFRSPECIEILKEADVVVTNPPFSLFRSYVALLMEYDKKFLVIGNQNAITYKEIFPLIKDNKIWTGYCFNKTMEFIMPDDYELKGKAFIDKNGKKHGFVPAITWFTNIDTKKRHEKLILYKHYNESKNDYPKYADIDAINVSGINDIPCDYYENIGVPITFFDKYNPDQFEIIECCEPCIELNTYKKTSYFKNYVSRQKTHNGVLCQKTYHRLIIKRKHEV